jgi:hypothetical protein
MNIVKEDAATPKKTSPKKANKDKKKPKEKKELKEKKAPKGKEEPKGKKATAAKGKAKTGGPKKDEAIRTQRACLLVHVRIDIDAHWQNPLRVSSQPSLRPHSNPPLPEPIQPMLSNFPA